MSDEETPKATTASKLFEMIMPGRNRADLLDAKVVQMAARLKHKDIKTYAAWHTKLKGWTSLPMFNSLVNAKVAEGRAGAKKEAEQEAAEERVEQAIKDGRPVIEVGAPVTIAQDFRAQVRPHLMFTDGEWLDYREGAYRKQEERGIRAAMQAWLSSGVDNKAGNDFKPIKRDVDDAMDALKSEVFRSMEEAMPPSWLDPQDGDPDPKLMLSTKSGLVNVKTGALMDHTPRYFTRNAVPYVYVDSLYSDAKPLRWLAFLEQLWPDAEGGADVKRALQEIIGHLLTGETKYHKIFMLVGKPRAGKGVITRVMKALLGEANTVAKSADDMGTQFGRANLRGKQVMVVNDLRLGKKSNIGGITELLLNMSGEDEMSISVKYKDDWSGTLNCRAFLVSNAAMALPDQSGALLQRLVPLVLHKSFADKEDVNLTDKLLEELPLILNWAIEGLMRLEARGHFVQTADGLKMKQDISRSASVVHSFLNEVCDVATGHTVDKALLFDCFEGWCRESDIDHGYMQVTFTKELKTASGFVIEPLRTYAADGSRISVYTGVKLKPAYESHVWDSGHTDGF